MADRNSTARPKTVENDLRGHAARDLARAVSAHAVGKGDNAVFGIDCDAVLVELAHVADVRHSHDFNEFARHFREGFCWKIWV